MQIYAILNQKGGSCKTTTAVNLASALVEKKKKVLLIDFDAQASASSWCGFKNAEKGLYTFFTANDTNASILDIVSKTAIAGLEIIVASPWLVSADKMLAGEVGAETILKRHLDRLKPKPWDFVIIDCSPTLGIMSLNALVAADKVLVPIETHIMAVQGLAQLMKTVTMVKDRLNPRLNIDGILACRVNKRTRLSQDIIADLRKRFPTQMYKTIIRESIRIAEAPSFSKPITMYASKSSGAEDYRNLATEVIKRTLKEL